MTRLVLFISLLLSFSVFSQNLKGVDFIVSNYPEFENIDELSNKIKKDFTTDIERVRASYTWIANNIRYDVNFLTTPKNIIYTSEKDLEEQKIKLIEQRANSTFNSKKGICYDYASLFSEICKNMNIKSEIISGYAKNKVTAANKTPTLVNNHAWNKVIINNRPYLIDTTWSVTIIPNKNGYIKDINYDYFFTNPYLFILDHYPENFEDSLISKKDFSKLSFINFPKIYLRNYKNFQLIRSIKSRINKRIKTNTKFAFQTFKPVKNVSFYLGNKFYSNIPYHYKDNILTFDLNIENTNDNNLTLFINNKAVCSYWLDN